MIGNIGKDIGKELDLVNPEEYTDNSYFSTNS